MAAPLRIGVIGATSTVARLAVLPAIEAAENCTLVATASLSDPAARYHSYEALLADGDVEAVYVPLPNSLHREWTERAAAAGKHVLCEKPLGADADDVLAMAAACQEAGVVLMEAYMTPFHPRDAAVYELVAGGGIGAVLAVTSRFTGVLGRPDDHRWHPEMGGGALLDLGVYCLTPLLRAVGADPADPGAVGEVAAVAKRNAFGVDSTFSGWLDLKEGRCGTFTCSFEAPEEQSVRILGSEASLSVPRAFTAGRNDRTFELIRRDGSREEVVTEGDDPYRAMVEHFARVVRGEEAPRRPPTVSLALQRLVDRLRWRAGPAAT